MHNNRGKIRNRERARQLRDYSGLRIENITPTDIDGLIEYKNKAYVIIELKLEGVKLPSGQRLAFERLTDDLERSGKPTICVIASHNADDPKKDIDCANASVTEYRLKGEWTLIRPGLTITVRKICDLFLGDLGIGLEDFRCLCMDTVKTEELGGYKID